jgi:hypothetical protein
VSELFSNLFLFYSFQRAFEQNGDNVRNLTVEASFGAEREISLEKITAHANDDYECHLHFPQTNNGIFSIGRDVNIRFQNSAIEAEDPENTNKVNGCGRISVTVWGQAENVLEELGSPPPWSKSSGSQSKQRLI